MRGKLFVKETFFKRSSFPIFFPHRFPLYLPLVKKTIKHNHSLFLKQFLATALLLMILLFSCSLKRGFKVLFDIPVNTVQVGNFGTPVASTTQNQMSCLKCADFQVLTSDGFDQSIIQNLSSAVLLTVVFSLFLLPFFRSDDNPIHKQPLLGKAIPKYLLFSRLIFYDLR